MTEEAIDEIKEKREEKYKNMKEKKMERKDCGGVR